MAMPQEFIPDAAEGSAPNLDMTRRRGRSAPSEGGESNHSLALSSLSRMRLDNEGIPIAQKVGDKVFNYFDADENLISKEVALEKAGGVVYYQDQHNPAKGRLRHRGSFVSADDARTIASGSRASKCSDVANLRDLEGFEALPRVVEDEKTEEERAQDAEELDQEDTCEEETMQEKGSGKRDLVHLTWSILLILLVVFVFGASSASTEVVVSDAKLLQGLDPTLIQLLSKHETTECSEYDIDCKGSSATGYFLEAPLRIIFGESYSLESRKASAAAEVERILRTRKVSEILGDGTKSEQREAFKRIARLLHPDKGIVATDDARAALALRLAFAARGNSSD